MQDDPATPQCRRAPELGDLASGLSVSFIPLFVYGTCLVDWTTPTALTPQNHTAVSLVTTPQFMSDYGQCTGLHATRDEIYGIRVYIQNALSGNAPIYRDFPSYADVLFTR